MKKKNPSRRISRYLSLSKGERFNVLMGVINERLLNSRAQIGVFSIEHYKDNPNRAIFL